MQTALKWEEKYLNLLKEQGKYKLIINLLVVLLIIILDPTTCGSADILELLNKAASSYATAIRIAPKDSRGHIGLGIVMEEMFYVGDLFGHKPIEVLREYVLYMYVCMCVRQICSINNMCYVCVSTRYYQCFIIRSKYYIQCHKTHNTITIIIPYY